MRPGAQAKGPSQNYTVNESARRTRRRLLKFLAASPLLGLGVYRTASARGSEPASVMYSDILEALSQSEPPIASPQAAINVFDFERVARARLKAGTSMRLVIKGIVTGEDATLCLEHGVDGIIVSNHGGRAENSGRSTIECLPKVVGAVAGKIPVLIDSGFRRGTDIFKALALGADAVCIGRPYLWGLASFGQPGVEAVLDILRRELELVMRQCGPTSLDEIDRQFVI